MLAWDNLRAHLMPQMRAFIEANADWLTVFQSPSYAPALNPQEGMWSLVKRTIGNLAAATLDQLAGTVKRSLKQIQCRPHLVDGYLARTGLTMDELTTIRPTSRIQELGWRQPQTGTVSRAVLL
ncbi:transposase [Streptomyces sp. NPDC048270]|uniref:transposase n=1 Tax=Streptomyces sp. NPDC048270 TaxID=3154615 RepID=UPI0033C8F9AE